MRGLRKKKWRPVCQSSQMSTIGIFWRSDMVFSVEIEFVLKYINPIWTHFNKWKMLRYRVDWIINSSCGNRLTDSDFLMNESYGTTPWSEAHFFHSFHKFWYENANLDESVSQRALWVLYVHCCIMGILSEHPTVWRSTAFLNVVNEIVIQRKSSYTY